MRTRLVASPKCRFGLTLDLVHQCGRELDGLATLEPFTDQGLELEEARVLAFGEQTDRLVDHLTGVGKWPEATSCSILASIWGESWTVIEGSSYRPD
jgi:hypothetical protein